MPIYDMIKKELEEKPEPLLTGKDLIGLGFEEGHGYRKLGTC